MKQDVEQNYENHRKYDPVYLATWAALALALLVATAALLPVFPRDTALLITQLLLVCVLVCLAVTLFKTRRYPLLLQDRIIRLEMQLRLQRLLPADDHWQINGLSNDQILALRFASDEELPDLMRKALDENITERDAIKRMVKYWTPDYDRI